MECLALEIVGTLTLLKYSERLIFLRKLLILYSSFAKTKTAASSENSGQKSTENDPLEVLYKHTICKGVSQ